MAPTPERRHDLARTLGHPVDLMLRGSGDGVDVAVSRIGEPPRVRAAWVDRTGQVVARIGCPPGVPSATRPITACLVDVSADGISDHLVLGRAAPGVASVRAILLGGSAMDIAVEDGIVAGHVPSDAPVAALDAISAGGEAIGRLLRTGVGEMTLVAGRIEGRLGASHGMAAGFGAGDTVARLEIAEMEAGYAALLPTWLPAGFARGPVRVEPEAAYPFAPPSIALAWSPADEGARVLLRQAPGPLAVPELPDGHGRGVTIGSAVGVMRVRGMAFLVWEAGSRAFGLQVRGTVDPEGDALRVARSIPAPPPAMP
jgi:hypothetical protein